ncbi:MAG: hypothetical protein IPJ79_12780 [Bacteroidetes bacterium]|nr:hypothetical protein [Bacteroidota bacterium]
MGRNWSEKFQLCNSPSFINITKYIFLNIADATFSPDGNIILVAAGDIK